MSRSQLPGQLLVMTWLIVDGMLGLEDRARHELLGMLIGQPVEHPIRLMSSCHHPC